MKRSFDLALSIICIFITSPLILTIILVYCLHGTSQIIFIQRRIGFNQKQFRLYKFRSLAIDERKEFQAREFPLGRFLRKTSLDELPQLWNILLGQMSFVGPRPLPIEYLPYFKEKQLRRFEIKPGLTGWAQINGRNSIDWNTKFKLDIDYVNQRSMGLDIKILFKTIKVVLKGEQYAKGEISLIEYVLKE